jgi:hypothetical protein
MPIHPERPGYPAPDDTPRPSVTVIQTIKGDVRTVPGTYQHSDNCAAAFARYAEEEKAFAALWPDYCRTCYGYGEVGGGIDRDTGMSLADACPTCAEKGNCPRCAKPLEDESGETPCPSCGWAWGRNPGDCIPPPPECLCGLWDEMPHFAGEE